MGGKASAIYPQVIDDHGGFRILIHPRLVRSAQVDARDAPESGGVRKLPAAHTACVDRLLNTGSSHSDPRRDNRTARSPVSIYDQHRTDSPSVESQSHTRTLRPA